MEFTMLNRILAIATAFVAGSAGLASAGVLVQPVQISEPMSLAIFGAGVGALYLVKKLRG